MGTNAVFTSPRERRLWLWAFAVLAAIWSTLALGGAWVEALRGSALLGIGFVAGFVVVLAAVAAEALSRRPRAREVFVAAAIGAAFWMVVVRMGIPVVERTHLFEYGLLAVLIHGALCERRGGGRRVAAPALYALVATATLGWIDEGIQALLPNRVYDLRDVGFNALAGLMTISASLLLRRVAGRT